MHSIAAAGAIPLWLKLTYTIFICVLVPLYWRYWGAANFLWFSDIALFVTLLALWLEQPLLASMQAISVLLPDLVWIVDLIVRLLARRDVTGITKYMFRPEIPLAVRCLSLFHVWLPPLLLWVVYRLGYDQRAWLAQTLLASFVLIICYFVTDPSANINWVFGPFGKPQTKLRRPVYLLLLMAFFTFCIYLPAHLVLAATMPSATD
jgi:hypothetical protein